MNVKRLSCPKNILTKNAGFSRILTRLMDTLDGQRILRAHIHITFIRADRTRRDHHAFNDRMRIPFHDRTVHEGPWVPFIPVTNNIFLIVLLNAAHIPFLTRRETTAATPAKARIDHVAAQLFICHLRVSLLRGIISADGHILVDIFRIKVPATLEHKTRLTLIKWDLLLITAMLLRHRININKRIDHFTRL